MTDQPPDERDKRSGVILRAAIAVDGCVLDRRVRNLSRQGACVDNEGDLAEGAAIRVSMGGLHDLSATVVWTRPHLAGLRFAREIDLDQARRPRSAAAGPTSGWMADMNSAYRRRG